MAKEVEKKNEKKLTRRQALSTAGKVALGVVVAGVVAGVGGYYAGSTAARPATVTKTETVTSTVTKTVGAPPATATTTAAPTEIPTYMRVKMGEWVQTFKYRKDPPWIIGVSSCFMTESWMVTWYKELELEAQALNACEGKGRDLIQEIIHVDAGGDIKKQISDIRDLMTEKVDALIIDACSPTALAPVVEEAYDKGFLVILNKNDVLTTKYVSYQNNDEVQFGYQSAKWLVEQLGGKGKILCFRGVPGYGVELQRWAGAKMVFDQYPGIKILAAEYGYWSYEKSKPVAKDMIAAHPDFDGIWSMGGQMSHAMVDAMLEAGYDVSKYPHASEDQNGFLKKVVKYNIPAYASAKPTWQSRLAIRVAFDALRGLPVRKDIIIPSPGFGPEEIKKIVRPELPDLVWCNTTLPDDLLKEMFKA